MPTDIGGHPWAGGVAGRIVMVFILVAINALLVAAEVTLLSAPADGDDARPNLITAIRIGCSVAAVGLGALGGAFWFVEVALLYVIFGVLVPGAIATQKPEIVRRYVLPIIHAFARAMTPVVWMIGGASNAVVRTFGIEGWVGFRPAHSPDELRTLVMNAHAQGEIEESDRAMLAGVFDFKQKRAHDVMRPRTEIVAISIDATEEEVWRTLRTERYSRYPVYQETLDDLIGVFLAKDFLLREGDDQPFELARFVREALYIPDSRPAERVLDDLRRTRAYMAVVLDEYGGTAGIVTVEDLVEEVMGDITDEYDMAARTALEMNGVLELAGELSLIDARSDHRLNIPEGDWTTLGGFVFAQLGRLPKVGDRVRIPDGELEVVAMDGRRVAALRVHRSTKVKEGSGVPQQS